MASLIIAMVLSAAVMRAYEQGKANTKARWDEARRRAEERGAQRERERQERAAAWSAWFDKGVSSGVRHPLWWAYAVSWTTGGAIAAIGAGAVGVYSGAITGGKSGYAIGIEAGKKGRKFGEAFQEWQNANHGKGEPVELGICGRCKGWIAKSELVASAQYGQVCPDCKKPAPSASGSTHESKERNDAFSRSDSDDEPIEVVHERKADASNRPRCSCGALAFSDSGACWSCLWREADYWDRVAEQGQERRRQEQRRGPRQPIRCACGNPTSTGPRCPSCEARFRVETEEERQKHGKAKQKEQGKAGPIRVTAERIYPEQEEETQPKEITNTMGELMSTNSSEVAATGEGLSDTLRTLNALAGLLNKAHEEMTNLGDSLTANSLDADTLSRINELNDLLDTAAPMAKELHRHVENRHNPVADAMAAAGGSSNVATKTFYDDH